MDTPAAAPTRTKTCSRPECAHGPVPLPVEMFGKDSTRADGLYPQCRDCRKLSKQRSDAKRQQREGARLNAAREARRTREQERLKKARRVAAERSATKYDCSARDQRALGEAGPRRASIPCFWCSRPVGDSGEPDHLIPITRGGSTGIGNLVPCCRKCNSHKFQRTPAEFVAYMVNIGHVPVAGSFLAQRMASWARVRSRRPHRR